MGWRYHTFLLTEVYNGEIQMTFITQPIIQVQPLTFKKGACHLKVNVAVVDKVTGQRSQEFEDDVHGGTVQLSQLLCANILGATQTTVVKDTGNTARTVSANSATSIIQMVAGTAGTTAAVTDYALTTQSSSTQGAQTATVSAVNTTTDVFTVTANMAAPGSGTIVYKEVGIYLTCATFVFCIARDYYSAGWSVDTTHYLVVTYTVTIS